MKQETFKIEGMSCMHCVGAVRKALEQLEGVEVKDVQIGKAEVEYDPEMVGRDQIAEAIEEEGYEVAA